MSSLLLSPQVSIKIDQVSYSLGWKEDEEAVLRKLRRTRCTGVRETPADKTGNRCIS